MLPHNTTIPKQKMGFAKPIVCERTYKISELFAVVQICLIAQASMLTSTKTNSTHIYWVIILQQTIASTTHLVARGVATHADPFLVVLIRVIIATAIFCAWFALQPSSFQKTPGRLLPDPKDVPLFFVLGFLNIPINQTLFVTGLKYTIPPNAALLYALTPTLVFVLSVLFYGEKPTPMKLTGIVLAFVGVLIVLFEKGLDLTSEYFLGNMLELGAVCGWTLYTVLGRSLTLKYGALYSITVSMITGLLWYVPLYPFLPVQMGIGELSGMVWLQILYLAVFATCASFAMWFYALGRMEASRVAVFSNLQPIGATLLTILVFGTVPTAWFFAGGALAIMGVILTQRK